MPENTLAHTCATLFSLMKKLLLLLFVILLPFVAPAQEQNAATASRKPYNEVYGQPLLVLTEKDPKLMVAGADVPTFALYEGGQIIYRQQGKSSNRYYQTQLAKEQLQELIGSLLISEDLMGLPNDTAVTTISRQPVNELVLNFDTLIVKQVYGDLRNDSLARENTPFAFLKVFDKLVEFSDSQAKEWLPDKIEVLVTDYLQPSTKQALKWPAGWPTLKSPDTIWRSEKLYSLYLDQKHYKELLSLMNKLKEKQAVEINGKKFIIDYRLPFPNIL